MTDKRWTINPINEEQQQKEEPAAHRKAFMHLSLLDEIICFHADEIESDYLIEIGEKCKQLGKACDTLLNNRVGDMK